MDGNVAQAEAISLKSYTYKVGKKGAVIGAVFVVGCLLVSKTMLSNDTEWHLFGAGDPFVLPTALVKLLWWAAFAMGATTIVLSRLPAQSIMLERDGVLVPNLLTRKYIKVLWSDVIQVNVNRHGLDIASRTQPASVAKLGLSDADWEDLNRELAARVPVNAVAS